MAQPTAQSRRRDKPVLSCTFCRGRKLRCDRQSPCSACVRRGKPVDCIFTCTEQERKDAIDYRPHARNQQARQRVARLESLVTQMRDREQNSHRPQADVELPSDALTGTETPSIYSEGYVADSMGKLSLTDNRSVYIGSSHWSTMLEDIQCLKNELLDEHSIESATPEPSSIDADLMTGSPATRISLLNSTACLSRDQILAMLPPRKVVDRHVAHFFNSCDFASFVLHRDQFLTEYATFWIDPSAAPVMWVGLLYSVMGMSAFVQQQDLGPLGLADEASQSTLETYRTLTIHCLTLGDYLRPSKYTIETLSLHFGVDHNVNLDASIGNWVLIGVVIRIALRLGLHRDPSHWPNISPVQTEFRRRLWMSLYQIDFFTSTQVGLPRIIKDSQCDTRPPTQFNDASLDFDQDGTSPEPPASDVSPLLFIIQRHDLIKIAAEIYDATEAVSLSSAAIATLDAKLQMTIGAIPAWLKQRPRQTSITDNPATTLYRMFIDVLIHKAVYLLHRRSFMRGSVIEEDKKSNKACIDAALAILEHQRRVNEETQAGGVLYSIRWKVASSLNHEFLQATMMLCLALSRRQEDTSDTASSVTFHEYEDILNALAVARSIWEKSANSSIEAQKAVNSINTVLKRMAPNKASMPDVHSSNVPDYPILFDQTVNHSNLDEPTFNWMSGVDDLGPFDYEQDLVLDPSILSIGGDTTDFTSM